jgi:hypothetical protein
MPIHSRTVLGVRVGMPARDVEPMSGNVEEAGNFVTLVGLSM